MSLRRVHRGGFFWTLSRAERDPWILRIAGATGKMIVVASSDASAERLAKRMTLSGVPVVLATGAKTEAIDTYCADGVSSLVTTLEAIELHGAVTAPIVVYTGVAESLRDYARRIDGIVAPVHVSFVTPELSAAAATLAAQLAEDDDVSVEIDSEPLAAVLEHAHSGPAVTLGVRRRFLLGR